MTTTLGLGGNMGGLEELADLGKDPFGRDLAYAHGVRTGRLVTGRPAGPLEELCAPAVEVDLLRAGGPEESDDRFLQGDGQVHAQRVRTDDEVQERDKDGEFEHCIISPGVVELGPALPGEETVEVLFPRAAEQEDVGPHLLGEVRDKPEIMTGRPLLGLELGSGARVEPDGGPAARKSEALEETLGLFFSFIGEAEDIFIAGLGDLGGLPNALLVGLLVPEELQLVVD